MENSRHQRWRRPLMKSAISSPLRLKRKMIKFCYLYISLRHDLVSRRKQKGLTTPSPYNRNSLKRVVRTKRLQKPISAPRRLFGRYENSVADSLQVWLRGEPLTSTYGREARARQCCKLLPRYNANGSLYRKLKPNHGQGSSGYMFKEDKTHRGGPSAGQLCGAARAARHVASLHRTAEGISRLLLRCASPPRCCGDVQHFKPGLERRRGGCKLREERRATCTVCPWPDTDAAPSLDQVRVRVASRAASLFPRGLRDNKSIPSLLVALVRSQPRGHASKGPPTDT